MKTDRQTYPDHYPRSIPVLYYGKRYEAAPVRVTGSRVEVDIRLASGQVRRRWVHWARIVPERRFVDALTCALSCSASLADLATKTDPSYRPSIYPRDALHRVLATAYNTFQALRQDPRRAFPDDGRSLYHGPSACRIWAQSALESGRPTFGTAQAALHALLEGRQTRELAAAGNRIKWHQGGVSVLENIPGDLSAERIRRARRQRRRGGAPRAESLRFDTTRPGF